MPPVVSTIFLFIAHKLNKPKLKETDWKKILVFGSPGVIVATGILLTNMLPNYGLYILGTSLVVSAIWPALDFKKRYKFALDAESATAQIMRDVAEARKAGLGPEKCVIRTTKRKDYGEFNTVSNNIANKLEWGMTLDNIFGYIKKEVTDFKIFNKFQSFV